MTGSDESPRRGASDGRRRIDLGVLLSRKRLAQTAWSVAGQGLSSTSNFALQLGLLLTLTPARFGSLVVGLSIYYLALALGRAWVGDPLVALAGAPAHAQRMWPHARARLAGLGLAAGFGIAMLSSAAPAVRTDLSLLAVAAPVLLLQDGYRYRAWAIGNPRAVVGLDGTWLAVGFIGVLLGAALDESLRPHPTSILLAWIGGGVVSWWVGSRRAAARPAPLVEEHPARSEEERTASHRLAANQAILALDSNGLPGAVAATSGAVVTAGLRAAVLPFAPMMSILGAIRLLLLPVLRRAVLDRHVGPTIAKLLVLQGGLATVLAGMSLVALSLVPDAWLGDSGLLARPWFALAAVVAVARVVGMPLADVLSLGAGGAKTTALRLLTTFGEWSATLGGAVYAGLEGAIVGRTLSAGFSLTIWLTAVIVAIRSGSVGQDIESGQNSMLDPDSLPLPG